MLLHPGADREHVRVEHYVLRWKANHIHKNVITALAYTNLLILGRGLPKLVESHHYYRRSVLLQQCCMLNKQSLSHLQRDTVHDGLALAPLQSSKHDLKLRRVQHKWNLSYLRLRHRYLHKLLHRHQPVQHAIVHIDVNHMCTIRDLLLSHIHRLHVLPSDDHLLECNRS